MLNLSAYSDQFGLELFLRDKGLYVIIGDLTTNPVGNAYRTTPIIGINGIFPGDSLELISETFRNVLEETRSKLILNLMNSGKIEVPRLSTIHKVRNVLRFSPLLSELNNHPEGTPIDLTQLGIKRGWTHDEYGGRQGFGKR